MEHEPDCEGFENADARRQDWCKSMCVGHHKCEPARDGDYMFCGECWHVFRTEEELVELFMRFDPDGPRPKAADINCCPVCIHDF